VAAPPQADQKKQPKKQAPQQVSIVFKRDQS
jgi:hypothetical protein